MAPLSSLSAGFPTAPTTSMNLSEPIITRISALEIARSLWLNPEAIISEDIVEKVNHASFYLNEKGFELRGISADGNCFLTAFMRSYATISRRIPLLDDQQDKIVYLREAIARKMELKNEKDRAQKIRTDGQWISAQGEGDLLAEALKMPIRMITVNKDQDGCGISDMLTFTESQRPSQNWHEIEEGEKPEEFILIVDLGGHFIYAAPPAFREPEPAVVLPHPFVPEIEPPIPFTAEFYRSSPVSSDDESSAVTAIFERSLVFLSLQPITIQGLQERNPQIERIYTGKKGNIPTFAPIAQPQEGVALSTIYQKVHLSPSLKPQSRWLGKVGAPTGLLKDDPLTVRSRTRKDINLDAILERISYDLYQELGRGLFKIPKTRLSSQPIVDPFTQEAVLAQEFQRFGVNDSLRLMSQFIDGYQDLRYATTLVDGLDPVDFITYLHNFRRPPISILTPKGKLVPLRGLIELLAVGRVLGDTDIIGGRGGNAGFVWIKNPQGKIIAAQVYKVDASECFNFKLEEPDHKGRLSFSKNWLVNTRARKDRKELGGGNTLEDERDLQTAQQDHRVTIKWASLLHEQREVFRATLFHCSRYLSEDAVLKYLFYREGRFNRSSVEQIPEQIALNLQKNFKEWLQLQLEIYQDELQLFLQTLHPPAPKFTTQVFIRSSTGKTFAVDISLSDTIEKSKAKVADVTGIAPHCQQWIYAGRKLEDRFTLMDYNCEADDVADVIIREVKPS